jgi:hypothetical protein
MSGMIVATFVIFAATLTRALLVHARIAPPTCAHCGLPRERQRLGDPRCKCAGDV